MNDKLKNRIKSLIWRAGGMSALALGAYILKIGDLWALDPKTLVNVAVMAFVGLVVGEVTKYMNS